MHWWLTKMAVVTKYELYKLLDNWKQVSTAWLEDDSIKVDEVDKARQAVEDAVDALYLHIEVE